MSIIIGIDLGTTNSAVACLDGKKVDIIPNAEGQTTTPSAVAFKTKSDGSIERIVGDLAKRNAVTNPDTILSIKRKMGTDEKVSAAGKDYTPQEISAMILEKLKRDAEDYLRQPVTKAVITVPAYFDDAQRTATKDAGKIAGLEVERIINEPTAASLAYGLDRDGVEENILVYDLGGGTFDVTILKLATGVFEVISTCGDNFLGGDDFDQVLVDHLNSKFKEKTGVNLEKDLMAQQRLKEQAEVAKKSLSTLLETKIMLAFISANSEGALHMEESVTRQEFEDMTAHLLERTIEPIHKALEDSGLDKSQLNEVLLVGGMTRMPSVANLVLKELGKTPNKKINPDEVVAVGAGIQGAVLAGDIQDILLLDVIPLTLSLETFGGKAFPLIHRNSTIPFKGKRVFSTATDNQEAVDIRISQGERPMSIDNKLLGEFTLSGIPPAPKGAPQIEVTFDVNNNGILNVSAVDLKTKKQQSITISNSSALTEEEIDRFVREAESNREADELKRDNVTIKISLQEALSRLTKVAENEDLELDPDEREEIFRAKRDSQRAIDDENFELIKTKLPVIEELITKLNQKLADFASDASTTASSEDVTEEDEGEPIEGEEEFDEEDDLEDEEEETEEEFDEEDDLEEEIE